MENLATILILLTVVTIVSAQLTCLRCDKDKNEYCPEIFDEAKKGNVSRVQCDVACIKSVQDLQSGVKVNRGCLDIEDDEEGSLQKFHGCQTQDRVFLGNPAKITRCVCHNDDCNTASVISSTIAMISLTALLTKLL